MIIAVTLAASFLVLRASHSDLMAIAKSPGVCEGSGCTADLLVAEPPETLVRGYMSCSEAATERVLSRVEAMDCATKYLQLKLSFLPDVAFENYSKLSAGQRAEANRRGYLYYLLWKDTEQARSGYLLKSSESDAKSLGAIADPY